MNDVDGFWRLAAELRRFWIWIATAASIPFLVQMLSIAPPWPSSIAILTSIVMTLSLIIAYQVIRPVRRAVVNIVICVGTVVLFAASVVYLLLLSTMTFEYQNGTGTGVKGIICTKIAERLYPERCPWLSEFELRQAEWDPSILWEPFSISVIKVGIATVWILCFFILSIIVASFFSYHQRRLRRD